MYCPQCGLKLADNAKFCGECGHQTDPLSSVHQKTVSIAKTVGNEGSNTNWYIEVIKKYAVFSGRARRKEYWMFALFNFLIYIALSFVGTLLGLETILAGFYSLFVLVPGISVTVRRLHDTNRNGSMIFLAFIPIVGAIYLIYLYCQDSDPQTNIYGINPKLSSA